MMQEIDATMLSSPAETPLAPAMLRGLGEKSYDKRKNAALEIEALVRVLQDSQDTDRICNIIALLGQDFATSTNANHRKGGLLGLAATAIGLGPDSKQYLDALLPPVLHCFDDPESRVRYYACESLFNISKVARQDVLLYFNQIFDGICKLYADFDVDVKSGSKVLDSLIKDIITDSSNFDVESFIPLLQKYIRKTHPYIRKLLVEWIEMLNSVPDINMIDWLPDFLDGLFNMLSDKNAEIRNSADKVLEEFLSEIQESPNVEFGPMVSILVGQCNSKERANRLIAIKWVQEFISLGGEKLLLFCSDLLRAVMFCISNKDEDIRAVAGQANRVLLDLVKSTNREMNLPPLLQSLTNQLSSSHEITKITTLEWLSMLLNKYPNKLGSYIEDILPALLRTLSDESDDVVLLVLQVLALIGSSMTDYKRVLNSIVDLFSVDRRLMEVRGCFIIRRLCDLLDARDIFISLARILIEKSDLSFTSSMVQTLNLILLTANELEPVRIALKASFEPDVNSSNFEVFTTLYSCWCFNAVSTFSLCLLSRAYNLSAALVDQFDHIEVSVGLLMQVDKLVQLLESPIFLHLRLQLLDVSSPSYPALIKSLYGILMLLPQSAAFRTLRDRLDIACSLQQNLSSTMRNFPTSSCSTAGSSLTHSRDGNGTERDTDAVSHSKNISGLLEQFKIAQSRHVEDRLVQLEGRRWLPQEASKDE